MQGWLPISLMLESVFPPLFFPSCSGFWHLLKSHFSFLPDIVSLTFVVPGTVSDLVTSEIFPSFLKPSLGEIIPRLICSFPSHICLSWPSNIWFSMSFLLAWHLHYNTYTEEISPLPSLNVLSSIILLYRFPCSCSNNKNVIYFSNYSYSCLISWVNLISRQPRKLG